jgi:hypothetical protein
LPLGSRNFKKVKRAGTAKPRVFLRDGLSQDLRVETGAKIRRTEVLRPWSLALRLQGWIGPKSEVKTISPPSRNGCRAGSKTSSQDHFHDKMIGAFSQTEPHSKIKFPYGTVQFHHGFSGFDRLGGINLDFVMIGMAAAIADQNSPEQKSEEDQASSEQSSGPVQNFLGRKCQAYTLHLYLLLKKRVPPDKNLAKSVARMELPD